MRRLLLIGLAVLLAACSSATGRVRATTRTSAPVATATTTVTTTVTTTALRPTTTLHPIRGPVSAIGDSVMIDASSALRAAIPTIQIDAAVSRSAIPAPSIVATLAASGQLGPSVVVGLVVNGGVSADRINRVLDVARGRRVVMVTGHCPSSVARRAERDHPRHVHACA